MHNYNSAAILMVGGHEMAGTVNPVKPQGHWLHDELIGMIMKKAGSSTLELWTGSGDSPYYTEGQRVLAHHDQSMRTKGDWVCIGAVRWFGDDKPAEVVFGEVPSRKIRHGVYK